MPLILALDTTHEFGSLALVRDGQTLEEEPLHEPAGFSGVLYARLEGLLARNGVPLSAVDCFAAASGPGSFTGVRVGLACIKGLGEGLAKPAIGVSNLEAMARFGAAPLRAVVTDARRSDIYGAVYDASGAVVSPEVVAKFDPWLATLPPGVPEFITTGLTLPLPAHAIAVTAPHCLAAAIARVAAERLARGDRGDPAAIDANYVRRSDAELFWKDATGSPSPRST